MPISRRTEDAHVGEPAEGAIADGDHVDQLAGPAALALPKGGEPRIGAPGRQVGERLEEIGSQRLRLQTGLVDPLQRQVLGQRMQHEAALEVRIERVEIEAGQLRHRIGDHADDGWILHVVAGVDQVLEVAGAQGLDRMDLRQIFRGKLERASGRRKETVAEPGGRQFLGAEMLLQDAGREFVAVLRFEQLAPGVETDVLARVTLLEQSDDQFLDGVVIVVGESNQFADRQVAGMGAGILGSVSAGLVGGRIEKPQHRFVQAKRAKGRLLEARHIGQDPDDETMHDLARHLDESGNPHGLDLAQQGAEIGLEGTDGELTHLFAPGPFEQREQGPRTALPELGEGTILQ